MNRQADKSTYDFIRSPLVEGEKFKAYNCNPKEAKEHKWTIGPGLCFYPDGKPVKEGDVITPAQSEQMFYERAKQFSKDVNDNATREFTQKQFNVLFSIAWNYGTGWYDKSHLIVKQFNSDPTNFVEIKRVLNMMDNKNRRMHEYEYLISK